MSKQSKDMSDREFKQHLKDPDPLQARLMRGFDFLNQNKVPVLAGVAVIVLGSLGYWGYSLFVDSQKVDLLSKLAAVESVYDKSLTAVDEKKQALQKQIDALSAAAKPSADKQANTAPTEQIKQLKQQMEGLKPDLGKARQELQAFYDSHKDQAEGFFAAMKLATMELTDGKQDQAATYLKHLAEQAKDYPIYQNLAQNALMGIYEDQKKFDEALTLADDLLKSAEEDAKAKLMVTKARLLVELNKAQDALGVLEQIIKDFGNSTEADQARAMKHVIESTKEPSS